MRTRGDGSRTEHDHVRCPVTQALHADDRPEWTDSSDLRRRPCRAQPVTPHITHTASPQLLGQLAAWPTAAIFGGSVVDFPSPPDVQSVLTWSPHEIIRTETQVVSARSHRAVVTPVRGRR